MLISRRLSGSLCLLTVSAVTIACKKNQVATQPPIVAPPRPAASKPKQRQTRVNQPAPAATAPASIPAQPEPAPQPRLGQILSAGEERRYNELIDRSLGSTRGSLSSIGTRKLTREQQITVQQIQDFMQQAQDTRGADLLAAKGLADKAEVLARDLVRSLK